MNKLYNTIFGKKWVVMKLMRHLLVQACKLALKAFPKRSSTHGLGSDDIFGKILKTPFAFNQTMLTPPTCGIAIPVIKILK